jgi:hypothetical protein
MTHSSALERTTKEPYDRDRGDGYDPHGDGDYEVAALVSIPAGPEASCMNGGIVTIDGDGLA